MNMRRFIFILIVCEFMSLASIAANKTIKGHVVDEFASNLGRFSLWYICKAYSVIPHTFTFLLVWGTMCLETLCILPVFTPLSLSCLQDYRELTAASPALLLQARLESCCCCRNR